jgi:hypothetical protein
MSEREDRERLVRWSKKQDSPPARGVYREKISPPGEQWYKVVTSAGKVGIVHLPEELCDPALEENLWKRLDAKDKGRHLKAV